MPVQLLEQPKPVRQQSLLYNSSDEHCVCDSERKIRWTKQEPESKSPIV